MEINKKKQFRNHLGFKSPLNQNLQKKKYNVAVVQKFGEFKLNMCKARSYQTPVINSLRSGINGSTVETLAVTITVQ